MQLGSTAGRCLSPWDVIAQDSYMRGHAAMEAQNILWSTGLHSSASATAGCLCVCVWGGSVEGWWGGLWF